MKEILIDGSEFGFQDFLQDGQDLGVTFHGRSPDENVKLRWRDCNRQHPLQISQPIRDG
jgi:hypothetical protein